LKTKLFTKGVGRMVKGLVTENKYGQKDLSMKDSGKIIEQMVQEG
jgi:hypothetical protein